MERRASSRRALGLEVDGDGEEGAMCPIKAPDYLNVWDVGKQQVRLGVLA
jgi:hypothetical protein